MDQPEDFESKFNDIIDNGQFEKPLMKVALEEMTQTLESMSLVQAQIAHILMECLDSDMLEMENAIIDLLQSLRMTSEQLLDELDIEIEFDDDDDTE